MLRPVGLVVIAAVAIGAVNGHPAPALHGRGLGVVIALAVFVATLAFTVQDGFIARAVSTQAGAIAAMGAAGVALVALQPRGPAELAAGAGVWMAVARLPLRLAAGIAAATTVGLALAEGLAGGSAAVVLAGILLCALLALVAFFIQQARASQETTEVLLAQLKDAREEQLRTAALTERSRIAAELHDVLAHSLSGAAIQLQGARKLVERNGAGLDVAAALDRAAELVRDGLGNARQAVDALRSDSTPGVADLDALVETFRRDMRTDVALRVEGTPSALSPDADLALYRGAQEALTNVARYAPGAPTTSRSATTRSASCSSSRIASRPAQSTGLRCSRSAAGTYRRPPRTRAAERRRAACRTDRGRLACRARGACVIRVVVADDQRAVREGLALLVGATDDIEVVGEAGNGVEAVQLARELRPDVVLMDLRMPELDGAAATRELRESGFADARARPHDVRR